MKIQIAFSGKANLETVREGLERVKKEFEGCELYSLFLPRHIMEEKGFSTEVIDLLDEVLPEHTYFNGGKENFEDFMSTLEQDRYTLAAFTDRLIILDSGVCDGVQKEIMARSPKILMW